MYDPYRDDYIGYDPIKDNREQRKIRAEELLRMRQINREDGKIFSNADLNRFCKTKKVDKLTIETAREKARSLMDFAEAPIPRYMPCGMDDAFGDRQDRARSQALAIWRSVGRY